MNTLIEIAGASVTMMPDAVWLDKIAAQTGSTHWSGKLSVPRNCTTDCLVRFDLAADRISASELHEWFTAQAAKRPWYRLNLGEQNGPSPLLAARASGTLRVAKFEVKKVIANQLFAQVDLDRGKVNMKNLRGQVLQGIHQGNWTIDASAQPLRYSATGTFQNVSLTQISMLMNDGWITGTGDATFEGTTSGMAWADLVANANAILHFTLRDGNFPHIESMSSTGSLSVHKLAGDLRLEKGIWELSTTRLESRDGMYQVSGKASAKDGLNFTLLRNDDRSWSLLGTLAKPRLERTSRTQAQATVSTKP